MTYIFMCIVGHKQMILNIYTMMGYIEYRIENFGLKKHLLESVDKKHIHRIKASSEIEKTKLYI